MSTEAPRKSKWWILPDAVINVLKTTLIIGPRLQAKSTYQWLNENFGYAPSAEMGGSPSYTLQAMAAGIQALLVILTAAALAGKIPWNTLKGIKAAIKGTPFTLKEFEQPGTNERLAMKPPVVTPPVTPTPPSPPPPMSRPNPASGWEAARSGNARAAHGLSGDLAAEAQADIAAHQPGRRP